MTELSLLHSPADIVSLVLVGLKVGTDPTLNQAWPVYVTSEPSSPDEVLTCYDTTWKDDGRLQVTGEQEYHFGLQIRVRSLTHKDGFAKAISVKDAITTQVSDTPVHLDGSVYIVHSIGEATVMMLGKDASNSQRSLFTVNCSATITRVS